MQIILPPADLIPHHCQVLLVLGGPDTLRFTGPAFLNCDTPGCRWWRRLCDLPDLGKLPGSGRRHCQWHAAPSAPVLLLFVRSFFIAPFQCDNLVSPGNKKTGLPMMAACLFLVPLKYQIIRSVPSPVAGSLQV